jgi:RNA polymerase sigma-70 factor (ECF subfamily)
MAQKDDNKIVGDYLAGDLDSFDMLVKHYLKPVYNFVFRLSNNKNEANDIVQEVFVKVWKNLKKFNPDKNFKTWILTIARNTTIDWLRKKRNIVFSELNRLDEEGGEKYFEETIADIEPLPDEIFMKKELDKEVEKVLSKLRPDFREIILLHYTEELTFEQISEIVGKPLNTVKSQHRRALNTLRKFIIE